MGDVVDLVSLHADARTIETVFEVGRERFGSDFPAWTPVAVTALPAPGTLVTLAAVAHLGDAPKQCVVPDTIKWWRELPASAGCRKGDLLFVAGQYGSDADGNVNTPGDHAGQARNALNRIKEICELAGAGLDDAIAVTSFHQDPRWIPSVRTVYEEEFFGGLDGGRPGVERCRGARPAEAGHAGPVPRRGGRRRTPHAGRGDRGSAHRRGRRRGPAAATRRRRLTRPSRRSASRSPRPARRSRTSSSSFPSTSTPRRSRRRPGWAASCSATSLRSGPRPA